MSELDKDEGKFTVKRGAIPSSKDDIAHAKPFIPDQLDFDVEPDQDAAVQDVPEASPGKSPP